MHIHKLPARAAVGVALGLLLSATVAEAEFKLGVVDRRRAIMSSSAGRAGEDELAKLLEQKKKNIEPKEKELRRMAEEFEAQRFVLSQDALEDRQLDLMKRQRDLKREMEEAQESLKIEERKTLSPLLKELDAAVREVGLEKKFDLILDRSNPGVLYYVDALDITDLVIKRLNESGGKGE